MDTTSLLVFELSHRMLGVEEKSIFWETLKEMNVDAAIWDVYASFLRRSSRVTIPQILRVYDQSHLIAVCFLVKCRHYGKSLFSSRILSRVLDGVGMPCYLWVRTGICADILANPGFFVNGVDRNRVILEMIKFLERRVPFVMVVDKKSEDHLHHRAGCFDYVKDGAVNITGFSGVEEYIQLHANIKRKIKGFINKGGVIEVQTGALEHEVTMMTRSVRSTVKKSMIQAPFQDIFTELVEETCRSRSERLVYFIARMKGEFLGYHSFLLTGNCLRMIHGAFNREKSTTFHAYENLIIEAVRFGLEKGLETIYFGPVFNETKRRMMNVTESSAYYLYCHPLLKPFVFSVFKHSKLQSGKVLEYV